MGTGFAKGAVGSARGCGRGDIDRHRYRSGGRETEADLPPAGHFDIEMREQFGVEQRAMLDAVAAVDAIAGAERVEAVLRAGMALARHLHRAAHAHHVERRPPGARQLGIDEAERSEEHTSELQSLLRLSYAVCCLKKKKNP